MQGYTAAGAEVPGPMPNLRKGNPVVCDRQERFDGKRCPKDLSGEPISLRARIATPADVAGAPVSNRPCRDGWSRGTVPEHVMGKADPRNARFPGIANLPSMVSTNPANIKKVKANRHFGVDRQYEDF